MSVTASHALAILAMFIISTIFSLGDEIADTMPSSVLMALRFGLAALLFAPYIMWRYGARSPQTPHHKPMPALSLGIWGRSVDVG